MNRTLIKKADLVLPDKVVRDKDVLVENGKIIRIGNGGSLSCRDQEVCVDGNGLYLSPGFIDIHFHGMHSYLVDNGPEDLEQICCRLPAYGVTGFLPTVTPRPEGKDAEFLSTLSTTTYKGTHVLGFFLEGPFVAITGALPPEGLGTPSEKRVRSMRDACLPYRAVFAVSPDLPGSMECIPIMAENEAPVFLTHTRATVEQTLEGIGKGISHATHFYDVFPLPEETDPGVRPAGAVEAVLSEPHVSVDFILDGEHVDPIVVKMALQCKGPDKVCLISDANRGAGLPPGVYAGIGGSEVKFAYPGAPARMTKNTSSPGGLAGSGLLLNMAVANALKFLTIDLPLGVRMASLNPARVLGLADKKGIIEEGYDADLVLMDTSLNIRKTWVSGSCCFSAE